MIEFYHRCFVALIPSAMTQMFWLRMMGQTSSLLSQTAGSNLRMLPSLVLIKDS